MKQIQPIQHTTGGAIATQLLVTGRDDNFKDTAFFNWYLFDSLGQAVNNGVHVCENEDYILWEGGNEYPYFFVADRENLSIIGDV